MVKEFREFIMRGNVIDLAVGIVIGGAFGTIVASFVDDIIMPPIGYLLGRVDFANLFIDLAGGDHASLTAAREAGAPVIAYGAFINAVIQFLIVAFVIFLVVKAVNRMRRSAEEAEEATERECPFCLTSVPVAAKRCPACTSELGPAST